MNEGTRSGKSTIRLLGISAERPTNGFYLFWKNQLKILVFVDREEYQSFAILAHWEGCGPRGCCYYYYYYFVVVVVVVVVRFMTVFVAPRDSAYPKLRVVTVSPV
jgi:hypothetical protein